MEHLPSKSRPSLVNKEAEYFKLYEDAWLALATNGPMAVKVLAAHLGWGSNPLLPAKVGGLNILFGRAGGMFWDLSRNNRHEFVLTASELVPKQEHMKWIQLPCFTKEGKALSQDERFAKNPFYRPNRPESQVDVAQAVESVLATQQVLPEPEPIEMKIPTRSKPVVMGSPEDIQARIQAAVAQVMAGYSPPAPPVVPKQVEIKADFSFETVVLRRGLWDMINGTQRVELIMDQVGGNEALKSGDRILVYVNPEVVP